MTPLGQERSVANAEAEKHLSGAEVALKQSRRNWRSKTQASTERCSRWRTGSRSNSEELKASRRELEDRMQRQLDEQKASFRKQLQTVSELWRARALQSAEKRREMEEKVQPKMDNEEASEQKRLNKRETRKIRKSSSGVCGNGRSGDGNHKLSLQSISSSHP